MVPAALSLVLLDATSDPAEERLAEELMLAGVEVRWAAAPPDFATAALPAQLDRVRPGLLPGEPTAWLVADDQTLHLSVAFIEAERAVVRVVDAARGDEARLALTARELVATAVLHEVPNPAPPPPPAPAPTPVPPPEGAGVDWQVGILGLLPMPGPPSPRGGLEVEVGRPIGLALGLQLADQQIRPTAHLVGRWRILRGALGVDLVRLPWVLWAEPRAEIGVSVPLPGGIFVEPRLRGTAIRDRVERGDVVLYDSGWVEAGIVIGWRQIHRSP